MRQNIVRICRKCDYESENKDNLYCPMCGDEFYFTCKKCGNKQNIHEKGFTCLNKIRIEKKWKECNSDGKIGEAWII